MTQGDRSEKDNSKTRPDHCLKKMLFESSLFEEKEEISFIDKHPQYLGLFYLITLLGGEITPAIKFANQEKTDNQRHDTEILPLKACPLPDLFCQRDHSSTKNKEELNVVGLKCANYLFEIMKDQPEIPFENPIDGCAARAHAMSRILEDMHIISGKIFLTGDLNVQNKDGTSINWNYHVAPYLKGENTDYVLDPSLFEKAVPLTVWEKRQTEFGYKDESFVTNRFHYVPTDHYREMHEYNPSYLKHMKKTMEYYKLK
jgi:hypothetical protein